MRLGDIWTYVNKTAAGWITHLDLILATNLLIWVEIWGLEAFLKLKRLGVFNSIEDFVEITSSLSSYVKRWPYDDGCKQAFAEMNVLTGYLQNDITETNWNEEFQKLANSGEEHGLIGENILETMQSIMNRTMSILPSGTFITFRQFIEQGEWLTTGSSSIGQVRWAYGDEKGKFKARKNMVEYIYTADEIWEIVSNWNGRLKSKVFKKDELSKRRLAVASNIESYLHETYALMLMGKNYLSWPMITLDETPKTAHNRTSDVCLKLRSGAWALPFDFKSFDHQPQTSEIQAMMAHNIKDIVVPEPYVKEWNRIKYKLINSYNNNTLTMHEGASEWNARMKGGLPSGVRMTSLFGNQWNALMTSRAREIAEKALGYRPRFTIGIRGDDTYVLADKAGELLVFRYAYMSINAKGLDSKFGIARNVCEFLRNQISSDEMRGWSNRSIPTITQRKPWTAMEWSLTAPSETTALNIYNLERRLGTPQPYLHKANCEKWERYTKQSRRWLAMPKMAGGVGCYEWAGWVTDKSVPKLELTNVTITSKVAPNQPSWMELPTHEQQILFATNKLKMAIVADDISSVTTESRKAALLHFRKLRCVWEKKSLDWSINDYVRTSAPPIDTNVYWPRQQSAICYESRRKAMEIISDYQALRGIITKSLGGLLEEYVPEFYTIMKRYERKGWHRTNAITLALGEQNTAVANGMNPILTAFVGEALKDAGSARWKGRDNILKRTYNVSQTTSKQLIQSPGYALYRF